MSASILGEKKFVKASIFLQFWEHIKFREDFYCEYFKFLVIKRRVKRQRGKKKTYGWGFYLRHFACMSCLSLALFLCMLDVLLKKFCISLSLSVSYGVFTYEIFSLSVIFWFFLTILSV